MPKMQSLATRHLLDLGDYKLTRLCNRLNPTNMKYNLDITCFFVLFKLAESYIDPYISGGDFAERNQYPHAVYLLISCKYELLCGGSILNQYIILTAAHCMDLCIKERFKTVEIRYGHEDFHKMQKNFMRRYVQHEQYDEKQVTNDISMMSTRKAIVFNRHVKRVIIMKYPPVVDYAFVSGWGLNEHGYSVYKLKHTNAQIQPAHICSRIGRLPRGTFCAGPITGLGTVTLGDSGGAIVIDGYIQIGVVSFTATKYSIAAYTNVSYHLGWIERNSKRLYCAGKNAKNVI